MHPEVPADQALARDAVWPWSQSSTAPTTRITYTCPMHPEIVRDQPGSCPICGMALEPRTVSVEEEVNPELVDMTRRFWISLIFTAPLVVLAMSDMPRRPVQHALSARLLAWIQLLGATPAVLWRGCHSLCVAGPPSSTAA